MSILHVDDDPELLDLTEAFLHREHADLDVIVETDVASGLSRVECERVDCIISDYEMPDADGLAFLKQVRDRDPDLPFILYTGKGSEDIASRAISAGVTDYLQKGAGQDQYALLVNRIENAVSEYRARKQVTRGFQALGAAREGISLLDQDGRFDYVNEAYADLVDYEPDDLLGRHWETLYPPEDVDRIYEEVLPEVPVSGRWSGVTTYVTGDGSRIEVDRALAYTDDGTMICLIREA